MKKFLFLLMAAFAVAGLVVSPAMAFKPGLPVKEIRFLIDVKNTDTNRIGKYVEGGPKTKGGKWAIEQAKRANKSVDKLPVWNGKTIEYNIDAIENTQDIAGVEFPTWTFVPRGMTKGGQYPMGGVPGPTIIADEGDLVRINLRNLSKNNHTIHIHGPTTIAYDHDGTMNVAQLAIKMDQEFVYEFVAGPSGTHIYHCHVNANEHMDMGLYGAIIVHGKNDEKVDQDLLVILDEWDSAFSKEEGFAPTTAADKQSAQVGHPRRIALFNLFTINGNAWTDEYPNVVAVTQGQKIRTRFINFGSSPHNIHLHGHTLHWIAWDGRNVYPYNNKISDKDMRSDSVAISPGERKDYIFEANQDGRWVWHCHFVPHATNDGVYHGGLLQAVVYLHPKKDGKGPYGGVLDGSGIDLDAYPLGMPVKIGEKPYDAVSSADDSSVSQVASK